MPFFPLRNVIGLRGEGGESYMTRRKKSLQRVGGNVRPRREATR